MITLINYLDIETQLSVKNCGPFPISLVSIAVSEAEARKVKKIHMTPDEYKAFLVRYTDVLPSAWNSGCKFHDIRIILI